MPYRLAFLFASLPPGKMTLATLVAAMPFDLWALLDPTNPLPYLGMVATVAAALSPWAKTWKDELEKRRIEQMEKERQDREDRLERERQARHDRLELERLEREAKYARHDLANQVNELKLTNHDLEARIVDLEAIIAATKITNHPEHQ